MPAVPAKRTPEKPASAGEAGGASEGKQRDLNRPSARAIFEQVAQNAREELDRGAAELAISGLAGGTTMGLTALGSAIALAHLGESLPARLLAALIYPVGFIAVILGRAQLFTENTLYPVALVLSERRHLGKTARLWAIVFSANVAGAFLFALLATRTSALEPLLVNALTHLGVTAGQQSAGHVFWSGVVGGWIIALAAWLVSGSHSVTGSFMVIYLLTFLVGAGQFAHCIASSGEILSSVLSGLLPAATYPKWLFFATAGNICGGICMVTLLEYGQTQDSQ